MTDLATVLGPGRLVDLTQPLGPMTTLWPGSTAFAATVVADYDTGGGYARELAVPEHAGTHLDAPAHFSPHGARVDALPLELLVRPAVKLDVRPWVREDAGATITAFALLELEERDGLIPAGSAVLVHTGWDAYVADPERYLGQASAPSFPGLAGDAGELLVERGAVGVGIDTLSVDPGASTDLAVHNITLPAGLWQLEGLVGLERVPARGAWLVAAPLLLVDGSGAPARVFAILPADE
jgi:kynurenine formamidase